ncbi:MAG: GHMP kinase, partial [Bacilli bacterium]
LSNNALKRLEENLLLMYVGGEHSASTILKQQSKNITVGDKEKGQQKICELTIKLKYELEHDNIDIVGEILDENWTIKKTLANGISNSKFDEWYEIALKNGGSGFFLFYVPKKNQKKFLEALSELPEMKFKFDYQGSTVVFVN